MARQVPEWIHLKFPSDLTCAREPKSEKRIVGSHLSILTVSASSNCTEGPTSSYQRPGVDFVRHVHRRKVFGRLCLPTKNPDTKIPTSSQFFVVVVHRFMTQSGSWKKLQHCANEGIGALHALTLVTEILFISDSVGCRARQDGGQSSSWLDNYDHPEWRCPFDSRLAFQN